MSQRNAALPLTLAWLFLSLPATVLADAAVPSAMTKNNVKGPLEQMIVTAQKSASGKQTAVVALSRLDQQEIESIAAVHVNEVIARVPGAWISRGNGQEHLTAVRSPVLTGAGSCGAVLIAENNVATRPVGLCNVNQLFEINTEQAGAIEILKGPGTVFYGSNALHGVINVISPEPRQGGKIKLELGPDDFARTQLRVGQEYDKQAIELRVTGSHDGGYKDDSGYDQQKVNLSHRYQGDDLRASSELSLSNLNQETAGYIYGQEAYKDSDLRRSNPNPEAFRDASSQRFSSTIEWLLGEGQKFSLTPFVRHSEMRFIQHFLPGQALEDNEQSSYGLNSVYSVELNDSVNWTVGLDLELADIELVEFQPKATVHSSKFLVATIPQGLHYDYQVDSQLAAVYSQWRWQLSEQTQLDAGLRYESLTYDYDNRMSSGVLKADSSPCTLFGNVKTCRHARPEDREDSFDNLSYQLGANHSLSDQLSVYGRAAKSFRAPQTAELYRLQKGQLTPNLDSESLLSFELGLRGQFSDDLFIDVSAYAMKKDDVIFRDGDGFYIDQAQTEHQGIELDLQYAISDNLALAYAGTWARHRYSNNPDPALGNIDGNDVDTAPRQQSSLRLAWDHSTDHGELRSELEWSYLGRHYLDPQNEHQYQGHSLINLRLNYRLAQWDLSARVTNLTDRSYAERADYAFGAYRYFAGQGRGVYVSAAYKW